MNFWFVWSLVLLKTVNIKNTSQKFSNCLNSSNTKNRQEKLSKIQLLKTHYIVENHKQNNKDSNDDSALQHDEKAWHALITTDENSSEQVYWNHAN